MKHLKNTAAFFQTPLYPLSPHAISPMVVSSSLAVCCAWSLQQGNRQHRRLAPVCCACCSFHCSLFLTQLLLCGFLHQLQSL